MLIKRKESWQESENSVTSENVYLNRRNILIGAAAAGAATLIPSVLAQPERKLAPLNARKTGYSPGESPSPYEAITQYNNYYEFGTGKSDPAQNAWRLQPKPWSIEVDGLVDKPATYGIEDLIDYNALEERIYRHRCVEAWSMVMPWIGVPLSSVLKKVGVQSGAKFIRFETLADKSQMPGLRWPVLDWPYTEGLRLDEAMHDLTFLVVGLYGKEIPNQNGAPVRLAVPWKYGFKHVKSIVRISLVEEQPVTSWQASAPREYGFYSNVNPEVSHPRWSQARERRIGEFGRRPTEKFNGYGELVADMYAGMDLAKYY